MTQQFSSIASTYDLFFRKEIIALNIRRDSSFDSVLTTFFFRMRSRPSNRILCRVLLSAPGGLSVNDQTGPCLTSATWHCRKNFSQWERGFLWKRRCHWLKGLRQHMIAVVRQGPVSLHMCRSIQIINLYRVSGYALFASLYYRVTLNKPVSASLMEYI